MVFDTQGLVVYTASCWHVLGLLWPQPLCPTIGIDPVTLVNPITGLVPCVLHATNSMNIDGICRVLRLPPAEKHRDKSLFLKWITAHTKEWVVGVLLVVLLVVAVVLVRR